MKGRDIEFDQFSKEDIYDMITRGDCTREDVAWYYNNEWWDDEV